MTGISRWERSRARLQARADGSALDTALFPVVATTASGASLRLRIEALKGQALTVEGHGASANDSHRGHLPPGVQLTPGEVLSTTDGDHYRVVPPIQRDSLGDTVGLSWLGRGARPPELPPVPNPDPTTPPTSPDPGTPGGSDWWNEGLP